MRAIIRPHPFTGTVRVPASKSHTIRRLLIAAMAEGDSEIDHPLDSLDTRSCVSVCRALGAEIREYRAPDPSNPNPPDEKGEKLLRWIVRGRRGAGFPYRGPGREPFLSGPPTGAHGCALPPKNSPLPLDTGNSGTTLFLALSLAALGTEPVELTGDEQVRRRSAGPLLEALTGLGIRAEAKGPRGCAPIIVQGPWKGGRVSLPCPTSQYLSSLLLAAPLAPSGTITEIDVPLLNERPYVELTLSCLAAQGVPYETGGDLSFFRIPGGFTYKPWNGPVPGDFSSAAFPACAAALTGEVTLLGLDPGDPQGDKQIFDILTRMGSAVSWTKESAGEKSPPEWTLRLSRRGPLRGGEFDLNAVPDLFPVLAAAAAHARGDTALVNAPHARIKETDRIAVMAAELGKLGVQTAERPDGLIIHGSGGLQGGAVDGRGDHRIVMALAAAALAARGPVEISGAECAAVTYPGFLELLNAETRP